ncbi:hypothetical protein IM543_03480 [Massilia sp. UMI-21]|nr:hypothetical protein IM543_03480 [Massilia sp. UMI-21]
MGKLFKLKQWLTLPQTAQHLTIICGEQVTEADVLQLALDRKLRISVYFLNHAKARAGTVVQYTRAELERAVESGLLPQDLTWETWSDGKMQLFAGDFFAEQLQKSLLLLASIPLGEDRYLTLDNFSMPIHGVWDLPMLGNECMSIQQELQNRTDGHTVKIKCHDGVFLESIDGKIVQLVETEDDEEGNAPPAKPRPASNLPKDGMLVVRTAVLQDFERLLLGEEPDTAERDVPEDRSYMSDKLVRTIQAAKKFWSNASRGDRDTHPSNSAVASWLSQHGFSETLADKVASVIRPEWAPSGRKPEK